VKYTPNLNLKKPDKTDPVLIDDLNDNMDILDTILGQLFVEEGEKGDKGDPPAHEWQGRNGSRNRGQNSTSGRFENPRKGVVING